MSSENGGSEKKNQVLKSIFRGGAIIFLGTIASKLLGLGYRVLVGRYLGPADYGIISVMMAVFGSATTIAFIGVQKGVQKYIAEHRAKNQDSKIKGKIWGGLQLITVPSVIVSVLLVAFSGFLANSVFHEPRAQLPIILVALVIPFRAWTQIFTAVTDAFEKMRYTVYTGRIWINTSKLLISLILVYLGYGYLGAVFGYAIAFTSAAFVAGYFAYKVFPEMFGGLETVYENRRILSHSWPLFASGVFSIVTGHIDTFMLQSFMGSESVGIYQAAFPFAALLTMAPSMFSNIFLSNASKLISLDKRNELLSTYRTTVKWISIIAVPILVMLFAFPRTALIVFGKQYFSADWVLRILLIGFFLKAITGPVGKIYQSVERTRLLLLTSVIVSVSNLLLNLFLIPIFGIVGAAWASTGAFVLVFFVEVFFIIKILGGSPFRLSVFKIWLASLIAILVPYGLANLFFNFTPEWFFVIALAVFCFIYAAALLIFRTIEEEDLVILRALRRKTGLEIEWLEKIIRRFT